MFLSRNKKNNVYPCKPQFYYIKVGFVGVKIIQAWFRDVFSGLSLLLRMVVCILAEQVSTLQTLGKLNWQSHGSFHTLIHSPK